MGSLDWFLSLEAAAAEGARFTFDPAVAEAERAEVLARFPLAGWPGLSVEAYALGASADSFCSLMEHRSRSLGSMPARHAGIHLIFRGQDGEWRYPPAYADIDAAWAALRAGFVQAFRLAERGLYDEIDALDVFSPGRLTLSKALSVYFPERFMPISARSHLDHFLRRAFGRDWRPERHGRMGPAAMSAALRSRLRALPALAGRSAPELMHWLYSWDGPKLAPPAVLVVTPGAGAVGWRQRFDAGELCVDWAELGALTALPNPRAVSAAVVAVEWAPDRAPEPAAKGLEVAAFRFAAAGSAVIVRAPSGEVLGAGRVAAPGYRWAQGPAALGHRLAVEGQGSLSGRVDLPQNGLSGGVVMLEAQDWDAVLGPLVRADGARPARWWLFQCNPRVYDLEGALRSGAPTSWHVSRFGEQMQPGDGVFLWVSGKGGGLRALAALGSTAHASSGARDPFVLDPGALPEGRQVVDLAWVRATPAGPGRAALLQHPLLAEMSLIKMPQATNYAVSEAEAEALLALLEPGAGGAGEAEAGEAEAGETEDSLPAGAPDDPHAPALSFEGLCRAFAEGGLHYPAELVANLLLALQVRRFVILTGVSGTGKTQIAMALAERYPLWRRASRPLCAPPPGAVVVELKPYMLAHRRFVVPVELAQHLAALAEGGGSDSIVVRWPGGEAPLTVWRGTALTVHLKGEARRWFVGALRVGQSFTLTLEGGDDEADGPLALRITLPADEAPRLVREPNLSVIPVRPDWTDSRGLLGYLNPITERYQTTPFLRLVLDAQAEVERAEAHGRPPRPFFAVLDEMNLARVEHYFAELLSALESEQPIPLHERPELEAGLGGERPVPQALRVPDNLFIVGTVNVDETTHMFSPKVLDRAFTIELGAVDLRGLGGAAPGGAPSPLALDRWSGALRYQGRARAERWAALRDEAGELSPEQQVIIDLHAILELEHRHFGYRVANELAALLLLARAQASHPEAVSVALDLGLLQKVLPKLHGTRPELGELLDRLIGRVAAAEPALPRTLAKLQRMKRRLDRLGFTSFVD